MVTVIQAIRSGIFTLFLFVSALIWGFLICVFLAPTPIHIRMQAARLWARTQLVALNLICGLSHSVVGAEHIPTSGCHVVMCKHSSAWETIALQIIFPDQSWVLKRELLWVPFIGWAMALCRPISIDRKAGRLAVRKVIEQGKARLSHAQWVVVFPEGTRVAPFERRRFGISGAVLAQEAGVKVVPVAHNAGLFWRRRGFLKRAGTIQVIIGKPIDTNTRDPKDIIEEVQQFIDLKTTELGA
jgi:1-acyl-sn-glycerol-3-phosphate acyltransferase